MSHKKSPDTPLTIAEMCGLSLLATTLLTKTEKMARIDCKNDLLAQFSFFTFSIEGVTGDFRAVR